MVDRKISADASLAAGSIAGGDLLAVVDISEVAAADRNKNISFTILETYLNTNLNFTNNAGTVTDVGGGTGLSSTGGTTPSISHDAHTGDVTGATSLLLNQIAISGQSAVSTLLVTDEFLIGNGATLQRASMNQLITAHSNELTTGLLGTDVLLISDGGVTSRMAVSVMNAYFNANLDFFDPSSGISTPWITGTVAAFFPVDLNGIVFTAGGDAARAIDTGRISIAGGDAWGNGGQIDLYGGTHGSQANDIELIADGSIELGYDHNVSIWNFQANAIETTGDIDGNIGTFGSLLTPTITGTVSALFPVDINDVVFSIGGDMYSSHATGGGALAIAGGSSGSSGGHIELYGENHSTKANTLELYASSTLTPKLLFSTASATFDDEVIIDNNGLSTVDTFLLGAITTDRPALQFDSGDYLGYIRGSNMYAFYFGGVAEFTLTAALADFGNTPITTTGTITGPLAADSVSNAELANVSAYTIKLNNSASSVNPQDVKVSGLTEEATPVAGDWLLGEESGGALRKFDVGNIGGGGGITWQLQATSTTLAVGNGYYFSGATAQVFTLPATFSQGDAPIYITNIDTADSVSVIPTTGDGLYLGNQSLAATSNAFDLNIGDSIMLIPRTSNATWLLVPLHVQGGLQPVVNLGTATTTEQIDIGECENYYVAIGADNVTLDINTVREHGQGYYAKKGQCWVHMNAAYTGLNVTTDNGTTNTINQGTPPSASGDDAILAWHYTRYNATEYLWVEWISML